MINSIKSLFGISSNTDFPQLIANGAQIIDVRSVGEYQSGHIKGSINIPLDMLSNHLHKMNKKKPVITCCASGMRSASAKNVLIANGFEEVVNGGGWISLQKKLN